MFNWSKKSTSKDACAWFNAGQRHALRVRVEADALRIVEHSQGWSDAILAQKWAGSRGAIVLGPESYVLGLVPAPDLGGEVDPLKIKEALRWSYAKDAEIDMAGADVEVLRAPGVDQGGALLKDSYWLFAIERSKLEQVLRPFEKSSLSVEVVDALATAQRNLEWAEIRGRAERDGGYASVVVGNSYSAIGIVSLDGDLLFHKQMEWTTSSLGTSESRERLVVDLQRNLTYFERRQSSFAVHKGHVFSSGAPALTAYLNENLGSFEWSAASYPGVEWGGNLIASNIDGDTSWLLGALWRWAR